MPNHKLKLSRGAFSLATSCLMSQGILKDPKHLWWAGLLLTAVFPQDMAPFLPDPKERPATEEEGDAHKKWTDAEVEEKEITEGQRDTLKHAISECVKQGLIRPSKYANELISTFGLAPE